MTYLRTPIQFDASGRTAAVDQATYIRGLIEHVLLTTPGERVHQPTFGAGLFNAVFGPGGPDIAVAIQDLVLAALDQWLGDLVLVESVDISGEDATVRVTVQYVLRDSGERRVDEFSPPGASP